MNIGLYYIILKIIKGGFNMATNLNISGTLVVGGGVQLNSTSLTAGNLLYIDGDKNIKTAQINQEEFEDLL